MKILAEFKYGRMIFLLLFICFPVISLVSDVLSAGEWARYVDSVHALSQQVDEVFAALQVNQEAAEDGLKILLRESVGVRPDLLLEGLPDPELVVERFNFLGTILSHFAGNILRILDVELAEVDTEEFVDVLRQGFSLGGIELSLILGEAAEHITDLSGLHGLDGAGVNRGNRREASHVPKHHSRFLLNEKS